MLSGINIANLRTLLAYQRTSIGLMAAATLVLARGSLLDWRSWLLWLVAMVLALRGKIAPAWLVLGGALAGWGLSLW